ncbi:MAG: tetraacyldisaccharide 4'-kinase [Gammaproteobacteria bacterium]|jgi:tetraacyldisaccharide 4'-kinase
MESVWYAQHPASYALMPLGWLYRGCASLRKLAYTSGLLSSYSAEVPVVIVGNITSGGTGKTPLVIWLVRYFRSLGYSPGVVARGYRGRATRWPQQVRPDSDPAVVGDEPIIIARRALCPVAVGPRRADAVEALLKHSDCDIIISDDGLQHYALERNFEIAVLDGVRRVGNGRSLPAGPLREPAERLTSVDLVVTNGIAGRGEFSMKYVSSIARKLNSHEEVALSDFSPKEVNAVAGIGNPERFFSMLRAKGLRVTAHRFRDHVRYQKKDFEFGNDLPILMTEKDAVKCEHLGLSRCWSVPIAAELPAVFEKRLSIVFGGADNG